MRQNAGYAIVGCCPLADPDEEIVLGHRDIELGRDPTPYVTWYCRDGDRYSMGHYIRDYVAAREDFVYRIARGY